MSLSAGDSPDRLARGGGVRRLNHYPLYIVMALLTLIVGAMAYVVYERAAVSRRPLGEGAHRVQDSLSTARTLIAGHGDGLIGANQAISTPPEPITIREAAPVPAAAPPLRPENDALLEELKRLQQLKRQAFETAVGATTEIAVEGAIAGSGESPSGSRPGLAGVAGGGAIGQASHTALARHPDLDPSLQGHNKAFLTRQQVTGYLPFQQQAPLSRFELKTGTVIPAVLVTGVNSDLPGQLIGQVSQDVYDTATGNHRLIPQGAKLIGNYSSRVALGQERVLVAWHRIVFPDASTLELATMPGADEAGYAGFHDRVNNHYWRLFGNALLLSVITAGIQLSQPQTSDGDRGFSAQQQIAGALGLQMGQVGAEMVRRNMQIQPTLEIRPGYRFNVMVNQDILFTRPWQG